MYLLPINPLTRSIRKRGEGESSAFQIWTNIDGECLYDLVEFPL